RLPRQQLQIPLGGDRLQVFLRRARLPETERRRDLGPGRRQPLRLDAFAHEVQDRLLPVGQFGHSKPVGAALAPRSMQVSILVPPETQKYIQENSKTSLSHFMRFGRKSRRERRSYSYFSTKARSKT